MFSRRSASSEALVLAAALAACTGTIGDAGSAAAASVPALDSLARSTLKLPAWPLNPHPNGACDA